MIKIFQKSLNLFIEKETKNILSGVSERNLCGRFAIILEATAHENGLKGYYADTEYNRKQNGKIKTILDENMEEISITCDLILHSRGEIITRDNLIAIEMKKSNRPEEEKISDRSRLRAMTKSNYDEIWSYDGKNHPEYVCGYNLGAFIQLNNSNKTIIIEYFKNGDFTHSKVYKYQDL